MEDQKYQDIQPGDIVLTGGDAYALAEEGEQLRFHVSKVATTMGTNYDTKLPERKLVVSLELDEPGEAQGQVYNSWFKPSIAERSNLAKLVKAVFGTIPVPFDPTSLLGMPLRGILVNKVRDGVTRQYVDTFVKASSEQKKVKIDNQAKDVILTADQVTGEPVNLDELDF